MLITGLIALGATALIAIVNGGAKVGHSAA